MNMNSLKIPENGVMLKGSASKDAGALPPQAFAISLSDNVIEDMIACVQNGNDISLALGANPSFRYGNKTHRITPPENQISDLYLTKPFESTREAYRLPLTMSIFSKPNKLGQATKAKMGKPRVEKVPVQKEKEDAAPSTSRKTPQSSNASSSSNIDSDIEALRKGLAAEEATKGRSVLVNALPASRKGAKKGGFLSGTTNTPRSVSQSPALKPNASPLPNLSAAEQSKERSKQLRRTLVHELAVRDQSTDHLKNKFDGPASEFRPTLERVADENSSTHMWSLRKNYFKDLDPWKYDYDINEDRTQAIDNAIKSFDKQRLSASEPEWQKLLPEEERGKGTCLSRLQGKLAAAAPKITLQKADDSSTSKDDENVLDIPRPEKMSRSNSNPLAKTKKTAATKKAAAGTKAKTNSVKVSPTKPKAASKANGRPPLSQEIIENSDSSGDEDAVVVERPRPVEPKSIAARPAVKPPAKTEEKPAPKASKPKATKPAAKEPVHQRPAAKRPASDDESSSSSGTPLSKRVKVRPPLASQKPKSRPIEVRQVSREVAAPVPQKHKNTSPVKSSPLASSPPTNASDLSDDERRIPAKKRKANGGDMMAPAPKRQAVSTEVMSQATKFRAYYQQYEALHHEISALDDPPMNKLDDLNNLRNRLALMKADIYKKHKSSRH